jgi:hypothetical protein
VRRAFATSCALALLLCGSAASAQSSLQVPWQFDFLNPGAKSLAMGGAFAGVADDATATFANPAGLTTLSGSEVSAELRGSRVQTPFLAGGRLSGPLIGTGIDTIPGPIYRNSLNADLGAGFLAGVYLAKSYKWAIAVYRHEVVRVDQSFFSQGVFQEDAIQSVQQRDFPQSGQRTIGITAYGASGAFTPRRNLSIGGSLAVYRFSIDSVFTRYLPDGGFDQAANVNSIQGRSTQTGSDVTVAPTVGVLIGPSSARVGVVYRHGPTFDYTTVAGTSLARPERFRVPHTLAVGASFRRALRASSPSTPAPQLTIAGEVTFIDYSRLREDFVVDQAQSSGRAASFSVDDGIEVHVGAQYAVPALNWRPRFRVGTWYDPDHSVQFTPSQGATLPADRLFDERMTASLSRDASRLHVTTGVGLTLAPHIDLNGGIDVTRQQFRGSTSLIVH